MLRPDPGSDFPIFALVFNQNYQHLVKPVHIIFKIFNLLISLLCLRLSEPDSVVSFQRGILM